MANTQRLALNELIEDIDDAIELAYNSNISKEMIIATLNYCIAGLIKQNPEETDKIYRTVEHPPKKRRALERGNKVRIIESAYKNMVGKMGEILLLKGTVMLNKPILVRIENGDGIQDAYFAKDELEFVDQGTAED